MHRHSRAFSDLCREIHSSVMHDTFYIVIDTVLTVTLIFFFLVHLVQLLENCTQEGSNNKHETTQYFKFPVFFSFFLFN